MLEDDTEHSFEDAAEKVRDDFWVVLISGVQYFAPGRVRSCRILITVIITSAITITVIIRFMISMLIITTIIIIIIIIIATTTTILSITIIITTIIICMMAGRQYLSCRHSAPAVARASSKEARAHR